MGAGLADLDVPFALDLRPRERVVAVIMPDWEVRLLFEALFGVIGLLAVSLALTGFDLARGRPPEGLGGGMLATMVFLFGPLLVQRLMAVRPVHVLTNERLIVDADQVIELREISRIRVWLTSVICTTREGRVGLNYLVNASAVAYLIRGALAPQGDG
jgi:hypothetical protein